MSLYNGPPRGGARGGKDQFNWENVKSDKDREFYLGHSVKASVGRWQKGKDLFWYSREKKDDAAAAVQHELATVKAREEELMMEALGLKPKTVRPKAQPQLDQLEMKKLLGKGEEEEEEDDRTEADQIKGIGYHGGQIVGAGGAEREVMAGVGMSRPAQGTTTGPNAAQQLPPPPRLSEKDLKKLRKAQKKELKKAKKKAKKAKKEARKEAKAAKASEERRQIRHDSSSSSDSEASSSPSPPRKRVKADTEPSENGLSDRKIGFQPEDKGPPANSKSALSAERPPRDAVLTRRRVGSPTARESRHESSLRHHDGDYRDRRRRERRDSRSPERSRQRYRSPERHHRRRHTP